MRSDHRPSGFSLIPLGTNFPGQVSSTLSNERIGYLGAAAIAGEKRNEPRLTASARRADDLVGLLRQWGGSLRTAAAEPMRGQLKSGNPLASEGSASAAFRA